MSEYDQKLVNRQQLKAARAHMEHDRRNYTDDFTELPVPDDYPGGSPPIRAWRNRTFLAQLFTEGDYERLTVNRAYLADNGRWRDGITWDELMDVKAGVGFGHRWAVELYPSEDAVVDVANMRHLWLVDRPDYAWTPT